MKIMESVLKETIRKNIISKRKELKMTQTELAERIGSKKNTIASWEQGLATPDIDTIAQLIAVFDMDVNEFTGIPPKESS